MHVGVYEDQCVCLWAPINDLCGYLCTLIKVCVGMLSVLVCVRVLKACVRIYNSA